MEVQTKNQEIGKINFFHGLTDTEIAQVAELCQERSYAVGELCQIEGKSSNQVHIITQGRVGTVVRIPNVTFMNSEIILDVLHDGDVFGWSALIQSTPWSTLRALDPTTVLYINADELMNLCETNNHIGFIIMKHLSSLIASRLRRNRMSILNAIVAIRGDW
jgi:CRP/FNR family transcriptional regulator, cyclic AMP receptor protein